MSLAQQLPLFLSRTRGLVDVQARYITGMSADGTHFVDQTGAPRLFIGEDNWNVLSYGGGWNSGDYQATYDAYFANRARQGFTAVEVSWCSWPQGALNQDGSDWDDVFPFTTDMDPSTAANATFWARRDAFFRTAARNGITVVINVTTPYLDIGGPAQRDWTNTQWTNFGTFLGNRYLNQPNIMWIVGDDYFGSYDTQLGVFHTALRATGDTHLYSVQIYGESTSRLDIYSGTKDPVGPSEHAQYEWGYTYIPCYDLVEKAQLYTPTVADDVQGVVPPLWADGFYISSATGGGQTDTRLIRQMIWWALSSGAAGVSVGDHEVWPWPSTAAATVANKSWHNNVMPAIARSFRGLDGWQRLYPDTSSQLVTAGRGSHVTNIVSGGSGEQYVSNTDNYVTASRTPDTGSGSTLAVIYCGLAMNITIDESKMKAGYTATWLDPVDGTTYPGTAGSTYNSTSARGNNSAGDPDWVLVLRG